ncbi:hypothetical protein GCM10028811_33100 [Uliginosibacterium sediminicola]
MPNKAQRRSAVSCTQGTPAGFPSGIPGIGLEIEGAMQQAAQAGRHSIAVEFVVDDVFMWFMGSQKLAGCRCSAFLSVCLLPSSQASIQS